MTASNLVPDILLRELRASRVVCTLPLRHPMGRARAQIEQKALAVAVSAPRPVNLIVWLGKG